MTPIRSCLQRSSICAWQLPYVAFAGTVLLEYQPWTGVPPYGCYLPSLVRRGLPFCGAAPSLAAFARNLQRT